MKWTLAASDPAAVSGLAAALGLGVPATRVLWTRGYRTPEAARKFFSPTLADLHDPYLLKDMAPAIARLKRAIQSKEKILLYGDYDVDGTSSVVILKKGLELLGATVSFHVPHRLRDGYGMRSEVVEEAATNGVSLIVSVDTGIRANQVVEHASTLNIDVIVTDHHLPEAALPPAHAVLNPNRPDCTYPEKNLCGAGVALKLIDALMADMSADLQWPPTKRERLLDSFLKLVAIATVADVVPLTGENRVIVKRGLSGLDQVRNPGLRALLDVAGFPDGKAPSAREVAFQVAPRINAAGRMASASDVIEMFLTDDPERARALASQLHELNQDRRQTEQEIAQSIVKLCLEQPITDEQHALIFAGEGWHRGVVGIVASRIVERYHRPVFVLGIENGTAQGSGRSIPQFHLLEALEAIAAMPVNSGSDAPSKCGVDVESTSTFDLQVESSAAPSARAGIQNPLSSTQPASAATTDPAATPTPSLGTTTLFTKFGGHHQAAGLTLPAEHIPLFRLRLQAHAATLLTPADFEPELQIDAEITLEELAQATQRDQPTIPQILSLAPFGAGNPPPVFLLKNVEFATTPEIKNEKHVFLQIKLPEINGKAPRPLRTKAWNAAERLAAFTSPPTTLLDGPQKVDLVIQFEEDPYSAARGYANWQTTIRDIRPSEAATPAAKAALSDVG